MKEIEADILKSDNIEWTVDDVADRLELKSWERYDPAIIGGNHVNRNRYIVRPQQLLATIQFKAILGF